MSFEYWDSVYSSKDAKYANYDGWLNRYHAIWKNAKNIIDLGCGCGVNSVFLHEHDINTIVCDFSKVALTLVKTALPQARTMCFDMTDGLPFEDGFSDLVIADLSLHYFTEETTLLILRDIHKVLSENGHLLCRVNSITDFEENENKAENIEIEHHLYESRKGIKRFFDGRDIIKFFRGWEIKHLSETNTAKYGPIKYVWKLCAAKN